MTKRAFEELKMLRDIPFTDNEYIEEIAHGDERVEVIGYIVRKDKSKIVSVKKGKKPTKILTFILSNGQDKFIRVIIYNDRIYELEESITKNRIIHIQRAQARSIHPLHMCESGIKLVEMELHIQNHTVVRFGGFHKNLTTRRVVKPIAFEDLPTSRGLICVEAFIRDEFVVKPKSTIATGAVCKDGKFVAVFWAKPAPEILQLERGCGVKITATVDISDHVISLNVEKPEDITKLKIEADLVDVISWNKKIATIYPE